MTSLVVCECRAGSSCSRFASETFAGEAGIAAESYKKSLWHATSGHVLGESELAKLKLDVAAVLSMGSQTPLPSTTEPPKFGNCARIFTIKLLKYRICQGSPHTAAALVLIPTFARSHHDYPVIPCLYGMVNNVQSGALPDFLMCNPDLTTVWPGGRTPEGYIRDSFMFNRDGQEIWHLWALTRAREMMGDPSAWVGWQYQYFAPVPPPARIEWPVPPPDSTLGFPATPELPAFTDAPIPMEDHLLEHPGYAATLHYTVNTGEFEITGGILRSNRIVPDTPCATDPSFGRFSPSNDEVSTVGTSTHSIRSTASSSSCPAFESGSDSSVDGESETSSTSSEFSVSMTASNVSTEARSAASRSQASVVFPAWTAPVTAPAWQSSTQPSYHTAPSAAQWAYRDRTPSTLLSPSYGPPFYPTGYFGSAGQSSWHQPCFSGRCLPGTACGCRAVFVGLGHYGG